MRQNFRNWKTGSYHSYPFLRVASVVAFNRNAPHWHLFSKLEKKFCRIHTFFLVSKVTYSLIYVMVSWSTSVSLCFREASEWRLARMVCQNGGKFERVKKILFTDIVFKAIFFVAHVLIIICIFNSKKLVYKVWTLEM